MKRILALTLLFAASVGAQSPTCGELVTTTFGTISPVYNWSTKQPDITLTVAAAGGSVTRSGDNVTYTTTTNPQTAGIIVGSCIKVRGVTDSNFNAGGDYALTSANRTGTTVAFTISTASLAPLPAGVTVDVVEVSDLNLSGAYTVLASPAPTATTFSASTIESGTLNTTGGEVAFCLRVTAVDATSITVSMPGGGTTSANGTITSARETRPMQGSTVRDYNFGADCDIENFFDGRNHATGNGYEIGVHYPSVFSCNPAFTKCFFTPNTSTVHINVADRTVIRNTAGGMVFHWDWARAGDPNATDNKLYRVSGCSIQTYDIDDASTAAVHTFTGCTSIGIGSGEGGGTGKEGQGRIYGATNTTVLPVVDETAGVKRFHVWQSNGSASSGNLLISVTGTSGVGYDNAKLFPVSGNMVIRTQNDGPTITSWTCSGGVVTMNHTSTTMKGTKIRVIRTPQAGIAGYYDFTIVSPTQLTYTLDGACPAASGGSGGYIGHLGGGFLYYKISDAGTLSNIIDGDVSHFDTGRDVQGDDVLIVHSAPMTTLTSCGGGSALVLVEADASKFTNGASSTEAYVATACTAWDGAFASGQDGWAALSGKVSNAACHRNENNIAAACTTAPKSNNIIFLAKLDHSADMAETYRMVFDRQPEGEDMRAQLSDDCAEILWMTRWREGASTFAPQFIARLQTGLTSCSSGGAAAPALTTVTPDTGEQGTTPAITLAGTNLDGANLVVSVSGADVTPNGCAADSAIQISCTNFTIGASAATGNRNVTATTDDGTSNAVIFSVTASSAPTLGSVSPASGIQGRAYTVTLTGTNFDLSATVGITGAGVSNVVNFRSPTTIIATFTIAVDALATARDVTVTTGQGTTTAQTFTVLPKPVVVGVGVPTDLRF